MSALRATLFFASSPQSSGRLVHQVHTIVPESPGPEIIVIVQPSPIN